VTRDYGYIGCSANVLDLLDRSCSGRRTCKVGVPTLRDLVQPCPKDLTSYLDVTYRCVSGNRDANFRHLLTVKILLIAVAIRLTYSRNFRVLQ